MSGRVEYPAIQCVARGDVTSKRLITRSELLTMVPYSIQHIYRLERAGQFPKRVHVGAHRVAWVLSEIDAFIAAKMADRATTVRQPPST